MSTLVDELLDALDSLDDGSCIVKNTKMTILASLGAGEIGDRWPVNEQDVSSWRQCRNYYIEARERRHDQLGDLLSDLLFAKTVELLCRSFTSKNAAAMFKKLSDRWESQQSRPHKKQ